MTAPAVAADDPCTGGHTTRDMGEWIVCVRCTATWKNPKWRGRIAATVRALVEAAPPLSGDQLDNLRRLIPHTA